MVILAMSEKILVVDDEKTACATLAQVLREEGYEVYEALDGKTAIDLVSKHDFAVALCDLCMPGMDGLEVLNKLREISPQTFVFIITAYATLETAIEALRKGAYDYIMKPIIFDYIIHKISRLLEYKDLALENQSLKQELDRKIPDFYEIVGESPAMKRIFELIKKVAPTKSNVLITGESGTGKELIARAIHYHSPRRLRRFVPINCSAIPEALLESELFGYTKGAFTGAVSDRDGFFKTAHEGTIFLDEIGDLPLTMEGKLLRVIEDKEVFPIGARSPIKVDVRVIAATNKNLELEVTNGRFREDFYYRLKVIELEIPPLRERKADIPLLVSHFIRKYNTELKKQFKGVSNGVMRTFLRNQWKGNVRELENIIERAMILGDGDYITLSDLPSNLVEGDNNEQTEEVKGESNLKATLKQFEKTYITNVLQNVNGDKKEAARALGLSLSSLYRKIEDLSIEALQEAG
jgi:two-component system response regulator PilR (NtrC family)